MRQLSSEAKAACHLGCLNAALEALRHPKARTAAKAAFHSGCLIAALEALRHPKALLASRLEAAPFRGNHLALPILPQRTREGWGNRTMFYGASDIQCGVAQLWHA